MSLRAPRRGQAIVEATLGILVFISVLLFGLHFAEITFTQMKVTEAAQAAIWDSTSGQMHVLPRVGGDFTGARTNFAMGRDYPLFARMNAGDQYPQAYEHAMKMFEQHLASLAKQGVKVRPGSKQYDEIQASIVPPYDVGKFPNKWRKMWSDQPARTLMAHLGKDSYSHIHYDSTQTRMISIRETVRLQSFPDAFEFRSKETTGSDRRRFEVPQYTQVGNAVPPMLAKAVGDHVAERLR